MPDELAASGAGRPAAADDPRPAARTAGYEPAVRVRTDRPGAVGPGAEPAETRPLYGFDRK